MFLSCPAFINSVVSANTVYAELFCHSECSFVGSIKTKGNLLPSHHCLVGVGALMRLIILLLDWDGCCTKHSIAQDTQTSGSIVSYCATGACISKKPSTRILQGWRNITVNVYPGHVQQIGQQGCQYVAIDWKWSLRVAFIPLVVFASPSCRGCCRGSRSRIVLRSNWFHNFGHDMNGFSCNLPLLGNVTAELKTWCIQTSHQGSR